MRLADLFNSFNIRFREVSNFVRYPVENISRIARRRGQNIYENIELPGNRQGEKSSEQSQSGKNQPQQYNSGSQLLESGEYGELRKEDYQYISNGNGKYPSNNSNGFNTSTTQTLLRESQSPPLSDRSTVRNSLPPLEIGQEIRGRRGRYRVESENLDRTSPNVHLYKGIHVLNNKVVWIKEYLIPESDFNEQEARKQKQEFERLANINFKTGGGKDFRLITPWDIIASRHERRCYLITEFTSNRMTLREYLHQNPGVMNCEQVRKVLEQVLTSLKYLHTASKINSITDPDQKAHGNLSLDSLLISTEEFEPNSDNQQFFIYLSDFYLWENIFRTPKQKLNSPSRENDLRDLGTVAFYLLNGTDRYTSYDNYHELLDEKYWVNLKDISLKYFIRCLWNLDRKFDNSEDALTFLLKLQPQNREYKEEVVEEKEEIEYVNKNQNFPISLFIIIFWLLIGFIGRISWLLINVSSETQDPLKTGSEASIRRIIEKKFPDRQKITYNALTSGNTLRYLMTTPNLVAAGKTFPQELSERADIGSESKLELNYQPVREIDNAIANVRNGESNFFITQELEEVLKKSLNERNLQFQDIAYEGIVVFVPFSESKRENSFPQALNGKISFEELRKLYSGEIKKWSDLNKELPNLPVELYIPKDDFIVNEFRKTIFKNDKNGEKYFEESIINGKITQQTTSKTLRTVLDEFENKNENGIGISFGTLSQVYNQCSVYPLAIGEQGKEVQPLIQNNGQDINPKTNLCKKGSYYPSPEAFNRDDKYPLKYPISVVELNNPKGNNSDQESNTASDKKLDCNGKFVEIFKTKEGKALLSEAGLVPTLDSKCKSNS